MNQHPAEWGIAGWPVAPLVELDLATDEEAAAFGLITLLRPGSVAANLARAEVDRRAALFVQAWMSSPNVSPNMTPKAAALRSVAADVTAGRL